MLKLIYGVPGSGKTYLTDSIILKLLKKGENVTLLVPEQEVMEAERRIADRADRAGVFCEKLTVVSFRRLANLAFRKFGGIEYKTLNEGGRLIVIWRITEELAPALRAYRNNRDRALCELLLSVCNELKRYRVSPAAVSKASDALEGTPLGDRLFDISLIYSAYLAEMNDEYSDTVDDVERLAELLKEHRFLSDTNLLADSFNGFTANELRVLEYAMLSCDLTVTLCRPSDNGCIGFRTVEMTERQLITAAEKHGTPVAPPIRLPDDSPYVNKNFRLIGEKLWDLSYTSSPEVGNDLVTLVFCRDRFFEAEYIAGRICELIRGGARYRDIAVIGRNSDEYEGILDVVFEKYGIPLFFSHRSKLTSTAFYRALSGALNVIAGGFKNEDVISYIKCGCSGLNDGDIALIESYTALWGISGKQWTDEYRWNMNPGGFSDRQSDCNVEILDRINELRLKIRDPLLKLRDSLRGECNIKDGVSALYTFMLEGGCSQFAKNSRSDEDVTVYNTMISLLDMLVSIGGDIPVNAKVMSGLLYMAAKNTDFGRIPQSFDCVIAGDAAILRASGRPHIFLTACENGVFPRAVADDSFFSDSDREVLSENGIQISSDTTQKNDDEMFYFLRAALSASGTLTATCTYANSKPFPSPGFLRLHALFPANPIRLYPDDYAPEERIQTLSSALDILRPDEKSPLYTVMRDIYAENGILLPPHKIPLSEKVNRVSAENTEKLFGHSLNMTQYRFEDYAKCPFSYYSKYILGLTEQKHSSFRPSDIGSYIHRILEKVISSLFPPGGERINVTDSELSEIIELEAETILIYALGEDFLRSGRLSALISRLTRTVTFLIKNLLAEFSHSRFVPRFFEMNIGGSNGLVKPLTVRTDDGTEISVYGVIDRVDTFVKDGNTYIRVVDYKTGSSVHSLKRIALGLDMQMYLYLFAICRSDSRELRKAIGVSEDSRLIPAGVMYHHSRLNAVQGPRPIPADDALIQAERSLVRSGVLLKDEEVLNAMEEGLEENYIPVSMKKSGLSMRQGELKTLEEFGEILEEISGVMKSIGNRIKAGCADISPLKLGNDSPCRYCRLHPFCRN